MSTPIQSERPRPLPQPDVSGKTDTSDGPKDRGRPGESLQDFAKRTGVPVKTLIEANPELKNGFRPGMVLRLATPQPPASRPAPSPAPSQAPSNGRDVVDLNPARPAGEPLLPHYSAPTANASPQAPTLPPDEQYVLSQGGKDALRSYQQGKAELAAAKREVADAHRIYKATGKIPQTTRAFSWIEIKEGRLMARSERYDAMLQKQGKPHATIGDVNNDKRNPEYLTKEEFREEFQSRVKKDKDACADEYIRPGKINKCVREVEEKYGGPGFKEWRDRRDRDTYRHVQHVGDKIDTMKRGGPGSLTGRVIGRAIGGEKGEEIGAKVGGGADLLARARIARGGGPGRISVSTSGPRNTPAIVSPKPPTVPAPKPTPPSKPTSQAPAGKPSSPAPPSKSNQGTPTVDTSSPRKPQPSGSTKSGDSQQTRTGSGTGSSRPRTKVDGEPRPDPYAVVPPDRPNATVTIRTSKGPKEMTHAEYSKRWKEANKWVTEEAYRLASEESHRNPRSHVTPSSFHRELEKRAQEAWGLAPNWKFNGNDPDRWFK